MRVATILAEVDRVCDYFPFVSTVSNIVDLFQKYVYKCLPENIAKNRYWTHIKWKEISRCIILLIPILGNFYIIINDYFEYKKDKTSCDQAIQCYQELQRSQAGMLAMVARQISGLQVTGDQMMAAPTEDEQRLWAGCLNNDLQMVQAQLKKKEVSPNFYHAGNTPLVTACQHGSADIVGLLLEHHAEVNTADRLGNTPFIAACTKGNLETVRLLRPHIQDIDATHPNGATPLILASAGGHREVVEFLLAQGADLRKKTSDGGDAVTNAMFLDHADLLPLLFEEEENVDERRYKFQIPSFNLFSFFDPPTIRNLTPLLYATIVGAEKSAAYLVERSNVQHLDSTLSNALYYSSQHMELLRALLAKCNTQEFVNQQNIAGSTPLHHAIELDQPDAALLLLQNGADPLIPDGHRGPLISTIDKGIKQALPGGVLGIVADYALKEEENQPGKTPLILACEKGLGNVVAYIQQHHSHRIDLIMQNQMTLATQAFQARNDQAQPERQDSGLSAAFGLMQSGLNLMQSSLEGRANDAQEIEDLGPPPRTGMELFLGRLPWPV